MTKRIHFAVTLLLVSVIAGSAIAQERAITPRDAESLARDLADAAKGEFYVIFSQGEEIYIDATREHGAAVGKRYVIERLGAEITHPVTGEKMGRARDRITDVEITWLGDGFSKAKVLEKGAGAQIRLRDLARPADPSMVLFLPVLEENMGKSKRAELVDAELLSILMGVNGLKVEEGAPTLSAPGSYQSAARRAEKALIVLTGRINSKGLLQLGLVRTSGAKVLKSYEFSLDENALLSLDQSGVAPVDPYSPPPSPPYVSTDPASVKTIESGEIAVKLDFIPEAATIGDLDGDGIDEIIFGEDRAIRIGVPGADGKFIEKAKIKSGFYNIMYLSAGDIDGDGRDELYVSEKPAQHFRTKGFRWVDGKLKSFDSLNNVLLRAVRGFGAEPDALYGQEYGHSRPLVDKVRRYRIEKNDFKKGEAEFAPEVTIFDFDRMGSMIGSLAPDNKIRVYDGAKNEVTRTVEAWGGSNRKIESADKRNSAEERIGLKAYDIDRDGAADLLAIQNILEGGMGSSFIRIGALQQYSNGRIAALKLAGGQLREIFTTRKYNGELRGLDVGNLRDGKPALFFFTIQKEGLMKKTATFYTIPL